MALNRFKLPAIAVFGDPLFPLFPRPDTRIHTFVGGALELPDAAFQPFCARDDAVMAGLLRRPSVQADALLASEGLAMQRGRAKVEIEELHAFGFEYLAQLVQHKIVHHVARAHVPDRGAHGDDDGADLDATGDGDGGDAEMTTAPGEASPRSLASIDLFEGF